MCMTSADCAITGLMFNSRTTTYCELRGPCILGRKMTRYETACQSFVSQLINGWIFETCSTSDTGTCCT